MDNVYKLLPCPFCGGEAKCDINDDRTGQILISCKICGISTDIYNPSDKAEAFAAWNRRNPETVTVWSQKIASLDELKSVHDLMAFEKYVRSDLRDELIKALDEANGITYREESDIISGGKRYMAKLTVARPAPSDDERESQEYVKRPEKS